MPRSPRIEYAGAVYHVMSRGMRADNIFLDNRDRKIFLRTLEETLEQTGWLLHAYVLMSTHYHLLLETPEENLSVGMQWLQGTYAKRFKARHRLIGPVFNNRFKSPLIQPDDPDYFRRVADYIHLNPARAKLLTKARPELKSYVWSSFPSYVGPKRKRPAWLECTRVLEGYPRVGDSVRGRELYCEEMEERAQGCMKGKVKVEEEAWKRIRRGWYLGDASFREHLEERLEGILAKRKRSSYVGEFVRRHDERAAEKLLKESLKVLGLEPNGLGELMKRDVRKQGLAWMLKGNTVMSNEWIGVRLAMGSRTNIFLAVKAYESTLATKAVRRCRRKLERLLVNS